MDNEIDLMIGELDKIGATHDSTPTSTPMPENIEEIVEALAKPKVTPQESRLMIKYDYGKDWEYPMDELSAKCFARVYHTSNTATTAFIATFPHIKQDDYFIQKANACLKNPLVRDFVHQERVNQEKINELNRDRLLLELSRIATADYRNIIDKETGDFMDIHDIDPNLTAAISSFELTEKLDKNGKVVKRFKNVKFMDKQKALELLAKINKWTEDPNADKTINNYGVMVVPNREVTSSEWSKKAVELDTISKLNAIDILKEDE